MAENKENKEKLFLNTQDGNNNNKKNWKALNVTDDKVMLESKGNPFLLWDHHSLSSCCVQPESMENTPHMKVKAYHY